MTTPPRRRPAGSWICSLSGPRSAASASACSLSYAAEAGLALGLAGLRCHAHPLELALEGAATGGVLLLLGLEASALLLEPAGVVALERMALPALELEDPPGHVVEEVAVVGDGHDGAVVVAERPLQPRDRLGVEVVGGLVEQQQVGLGQQQPAERHSALLAAGEGGDVGVARRQAQRVHGDLDLAVEVVGPRRLDLRLELRLLRADLLVVGVGLGVLGQHRVVALEQAGDLRDAVHHVALHVLGRVELWLLLQEAHREAGRQPRLHR